MAHSIQAIGKRHQIINDGDLLAIIGFALVLIRQSRPSTSLTEIAERWQKQIEGYGTGIIDLELEEFCEEPNRLSDMLLLLESVRRHVAQYGDTIPLAVMNELPRPSGVQFYDFKTSLVHETVEKLRNLLVPVNRE